MNLNRTCILASFVIGVVLLGGSAAQAISVSYSFTAQLQLTPFPIFSPGNDSFIGSFSLDTTVGPQVNDPGAPIQNAADFPAVRSLTVSLLNFTWTGSASDDLIIHHHYLAPNTPDSYFIFST